MLTMMRRSLGKVSHQSAIGIGHTIRKSLLLSSSSPFDFSTISSGNDDGSGGGTVSKSEENNKIKKKKTPRKSRIDDQTGNRKKVTTLLPPSTPILSSVVSSGAAGGDGGGNQPVQATTPIVANEEEVNKPESNPKNSIGILTMSTFVVKNNLFPTSNLDKILHNLKYQLNIGCPLDFKQGIEDAWWHLPSDEQCNLRAIFFIGGAINLNIPQAKAAGKRLKQNGVAVDVVNFWREGRYTHSKKALDAFVAAANNDNNSHIHHLQVEPSTRSKDVLLRVFNLDEGEIMRRKKAKEREKERARKNRVKLMLQAHHDNRVKEMSMGYY